MATKEMTWLMDETSDTEIILNDKSEVSDVVRSRDPISSQVVPGEVMSTIIILIALLQKGLRPILREICKRIEYISTAKNWS